MSKMVSWTRINKNGISEDKIKSKLKKLLSNQNGCIIGIQRIAAYIREQLSCNAKHGDIVDILIESGAVLVPSFSSKRNRFVFDITKCVLAKKKKQRGRTHKRV